MSGASPLTPSSRTTGWLLAALAVAVLPHASHLPLWATGLTMALFAWRAIALRRPLPLPRKWLLPALVIVSAVGVLASYGTLFGRDAGVALLTLMLGLKLMEMRGYRDRFILILLGYFLIITHFLYSQRLWMGAYLFTAALLMTAALIGVNHPLPSRRFSQNLRLAGTLLAQAIPLMLVLFILFPRISGPLWRVPTDAGSGVSGLSDTMSPGSISQLSLSNAVAFRVKFDGKPPPAKQLYWRGPVLWYTNGRSWRVGYPPPARPVRYQGFGKAVKYQVILEPDGRKWLFALDLPASVPTNAMLRPDYLLMRAAPVERRLRYVMTSYLHYRTEGATPAELHRALQLPPAANPRTRRLAAAWRAEAPDNAVLVAQALAYYRRHHFVYTLSPPALPGPNPVDRFLFNSRRGFCEHFAASFVTLMRAAGIPARVVTGYQGGEYNPLGHYWVVRQSDAHAWAEVWLKGRGWVREDPTAMVSPDRVESGIQSALPAAAALPGGFGEGGAWLRDLRYGWDFINGGWNLWVLGYSQQRQLQLLARLGLSGWAEMALALFAGGGGLLLLTAAFLLRGRRWRRADPVTAAYRRFCIRLARAAVVRGPSEGPLDFARRAARRLPAAASEIHRISALYTMLRYGRTRPLAQVAELRRRARRFSAPSA